jgi:hypothetical protein
MKKLSKKIIIYVYKYIFNWTIIAKNIAKPIKIYLNF